MVFVSYSLHFLIANLGAAPHTPILTRPHTGHTGDDFDCHPMFADTSRNLYHHLRKTNIPRHEGRREHIPDVPYLNVVLNINIITGIGLGLGFAYLGCKRFSAHKTFIVRLPKSLRGVEWC